LRNPSRVVSMADDGFRFRSTHPTSDPPRE
jgi:hypothetical protein